MKIERVYRVTLDDGSTATVAPCRLGLLLEHGDGRVMPHAENEAVWRRWPN